MYGTIMEMKFDYPLKFPAGWVRGNDNFTERNNFSQNLTLDEALIYLKDELSDLNIDQATLYSNFQNLNNPRLRKKVGKSFGASIEISNNKINYMLSCDKWPNIEHNIYALHLAIRNIRNMEAWGIAPISLTMSAFTENDNHNMPINSYDSSPEWMKVLGLGTTATLDDAAAIYRRRAKEVVGDNEEMVKLNLAMDEAKKVLR